MSELLAALEGALSGRGWLVTLAGEPGIGKTRTAQELATQAQENGARVLWGRCYEGEGAPPYWPWVQILRSYIQQQDPDQVRSLMGAGAADRNCPLEKNCRVLSHHQPWIAWSKPGSASSIPSPPS